MNLLLFEPEELAADSRLTLTDRRLEHLRQVLRVGVGDRLRVGQINGDCGEAEVEAIDKQRAELRVRLHRPPPAPLPVLLVLALPRPKMLRRILRGVAEVGVKHLHLINSFRVEKSYWQSPLMESATLRGYLLLGLEQAGDTQLPEVQLHARFRPFAEDVLPELLAGREGLLADPAASSAYPCAPRAPAALVIGPEGGFIPFENELLVKAGCRAVSLGERTLRVETALQCALGRHLSTPSCLPRELP